MTENPTNFIFIQCDQLAASFLPCYGNQLADTPNINKLAHRSIVFDSTYSNFPLCAPSRFSMMSGRLASKIDVFDNGAEFVSSIPTFVHYLRALNYQTCLVGKMHFVGADQLHGFEQRLTTDIYPSDFGWTGDWTETALPHSNNDRTFTGSGICLRNVQMEYDEEVSHRAARKIYDLARGYDNRPFLLTVSLTHPHDPYQCLKEDWDRYDHGDIDMPLVSRLDEAQWDPYSKRLMIQYGLESFTPTDEQIRVARHAYYGSISYLDRQVGKVLDTLAQTGLDENTVVVFTSDHGDMLGERGLWYKKIFFENSVRVPLMIYMPGIEHRHIQQNVSLVDLLPTMVDVATPENEAAEALIVDPLDGHSLLDLMKGDHSRWRDIVYSENLAEGATTAVLMVKAEHLKYVLSGKDPAQLFDLKTDPLELKNLAMAPEYCEELRKLDSLARQQWDVDELASRVEQSQRRRLFVRQTLRKGQPARWDYTPNDQAADHCLRGDQNYNNWAYNQVIGLKDNRKK